MGINFSHDAAVVLISDGKLLYAVEEEKISRVKQDFGWPRHSVSEVHRATGISPDAIDVIAFGSYYFKEIGKNEIKFRFLRKKSYKLLEVIDRILHYFGLSPSTVSSNNKILFPQMLRKMGYTNAKIEFYDHHLCHAYSANYTAPFLPDLVITCDGHGNGSSFNFYRNSPDTGLECIVAHDHLASIGQFYSSVTKLLGFRPNRHEGKITGLAAYGKPTELVEKFYDLFYYQNDKLRRFPAERTLEYWEQWDMSHKLSLKDKINLKSSESATGRQYGMNSLILLHHLEQVCESYSKEDVAYACQVVAEKVILNEIKRVCKKFYENKKIKVGLAGGVFANVRINQKIYELDFVENIFIQPAMGDSGLALGAAIISDIAEKGKRFDDAPYKFEHTYFGIDYSDKVEEALQDVSCEFFIERMQDTACQVAEKLAENAIIGFWHGPMEWGPRALGSRSIMLNTFDKSVNKTLNDRLNRTEFMPFAPVVLDFMAKEYFPCYDRKVPAADYMTITYDTNPKYKDILQAVVHVDGTARPQVITREKNPLYYDVLYEFYKITGCGALVNTSFNAHEEPIVSTPQVALSALQAGRIDYLVMDNLLISKKQ